MAANSSISSFKLPWACLISICLVLLVQVGFATVPALKKVLYTFGEPFHSDPVRISYLRDQAKIQSEQDSYMHIHLVGASQTREGLDVLLMNNRSKEDGLVFHNLGAAAYSAMDFYMEVDDIIASNPDLIVYMPYVGSFYLDYQFSRLRFYFNPNALPLLKEELGFEVLRENKYAIFDSYVSYLSYFYKHREGVKAIFFNAVNHLIFHFGEAPKVKIFNYTENFPDEYFEKQYEKYEGNKFYISKFTPVEKEAFRLTMAKLKANNIPVLVMDAPGNPLIEKTYQPEVRIDYDDFLQREVVQSGIPFMPLSEIPQFDKDDFIDFTHLNAGGRVRLSDFLVDYIKENRQLFE